MYMYMYMCQMKEFKIIVRAQLPSVHTYIGTYHEVIFPLLHYICVICNNNQSSDDGHKFLFLNRKNRSYIQDYVMIADLVALGIVPLVVLVVLNILIFREISRATRLHNAISTQKRNNSQAVKMLVAVVGVFALSHSLR